LESLKARVVLGGKNLEWRKLRGRSVGIRVITDTVQLFMNEVFAISTVS